MINGGYILQPRVFGTSDASKLPPVTREVWFLLLRGVNHKDNGQYKRGNGFFSLSDIQDKLSWYVGYRKMIYSKPQITKSLRRLCEENMIVKAKATRGVYVTICNYDFYQDPKNYEGNDEGSTKVARSEQQGHTKNKNVKNENKKECVEIVEFLNVTTGRSYKATTAATQKAVSARLLDGYTVEDFKSVIASKSNEWLGSDMEKFLTPDTLFRPSNFEKYLQNATGSKEEHDFV